MKEKEVKCANRFPHALIQIVYISPKECVGAATKRRDVKLDWLRIVDILINRSTRLVFARNVIISSTRRYTLKVHSITTNSRCTTMK